MSAVQGGPAMQTVVSSTRLDALDDCRRAMNRRCGMDQARMTISSDGNADGNKRHADASERGANAYGARRRRGGGCEKRAVVGCEAGGVVGVRCCVLGGMCEAAGNERAGQQSGERDGESEKVGKRNAGQPASQYQDQLAEPRWAGLGLAAASAVGSFLAWLGQAGRRRVGLANHSACWWSGGGWQVRKGSVRHDAAGLREAAGNSWELEQHSGLALEASCAAGVSDCITSYSVRQ